MKQKKMKHGMRLLSVLLVIAMLFTGTGLPARAEDIFSGTAEGKKTVRKSEEAGAIPIQTAKDLPEEILKGQVYELKADIVLENGQQIAQLDGSLDGKGHTITLADKPLADTVTGTIQNLGVTTVKGSVIESDQTFGSMAVQLSGIIQNCYSTAALKLNGWRGEVGGFVGTLSGGTIRNSYMAGSIKAMMAGGLAGINNTENSVLVNCSYVNGYGPVSMPNPHPQKMNIVQSTSEQLRGGEMNQALNTDLPDIGFYWTTPENGENDGFPVLKEGTPDSGGAEKPDVEEPEKEIPTEPVELPEEVIHLTSIQDFQSIENNGEGQYYVLDNDIVVNESYFSVINFEGVLEGQGHEIRFENGGGIFQNVEKEGVLQNIHFTGTMSGWTGGEYGPAGFSMRGAILNCYTDVTGEYASGFAKTLDGGIVSNCYSVSKGKLGALFYRYQSGKLFHTYWQEFLANTAVVPNEALTDSKEMSEESMKTLEFVETLNAKKGAHGVQWGQSRQGYPHFGENQEYNPDDAGFPENKYRVRFQFHDGVTEVLDSQILRLSPDEVDAFRIAGKFVLEDVPESSRISWETEEVNPSDAMLIGADEGELGLYKNGTAIVKAVETDAQGKTEVVATVKVIAKSKVMEEIRLFIDEQDVTEESFTVQGSEWKSIKVKARYEGEEEFVPVASSRFSYQASDSDYIYNMEGSSEFQFKKPGTATMTIVSKTYPDVSAKVELTSKYIPATSIRPAISGVKVLHGRNANSTDKQAFNPYYDGVIVSPENASFSSDWTVTSDHPEIAEYVDSMVKGYVPYRAGTAVFTASLEQTNPDTGKKETVSGISEVTFAYKNPLTSVTGSKEKIQIENFTEQKLDLEFAGTISGEGYSVTEPELVWTYEGTGSVKIARKETGYWKKEGFEGSPDYGEYLSSEDYYITAAKEGTVKATGTPIDTTGNANPIELEIEVIPGETPEVDVDALVKKGTDAAVTYIEDLHRDKDYAYNDEWDIYSLLRMGKAIEETQLEKYYQSVAEEVKTWEKTKKPTDIERVALALLSMGKDIMDVDGVNLAEMIYNHPKLDAGSNELSWALFALDAKGTVLPRTAKWTREKIVDALLKFQNEESGGFGLFDNTMTSVDMTAMSVQALAKYAKTDEKVQRAVEKGLQYLKDSMSGAYNYDNSNSVSQVLLTLTIRGIDPLNSEFGMPHENMITVLMNQYYSETDKGNGFVFRKGDKQVNKMATVQALQALTAYSQRENGKSYWDLTEKEVGTVAVTIMDGIRHNTALNLLLNPKLNVWELEAKGTMLQVEVPIYEEDSMMTAIERACKQNGLDIEIRGGEYISAIDGLAEFDRGGGSGWKGTLNGEWPDRGFNTITVENGELKNGDVITVEYTMNLGADLTENAELKNLSANGGKLQKEYQRDVYEYDLKVEEDVKEVRIEAETFNRYAKVEILSNGHSYQEGEAVQVENGTEIVITSTKAVRGQETKTYTLTVKQEEKPQYWGIRTEARVYDDFENDIWLQYQQKEMQVGDTADLRPWRMEQIISDAINNDVQRPMFHFEIISGDSISLSAENSKEKTVVKAEKPGTSVVKVTYDELEYKGKIWVAISPVNTAYAVFTVGETGTAKISCSEKLKNWRHYDTIYYTEGETVPYTFKASAEDAEELKVTLNGLEIQGDGNQYTANLENRSNIIGIEATDSTGNIRSMYRVIDARFIEVNIENKTNPGTPIYAGQTANISFRGITMPVYKLATVYNPAFGDGSWGSEAAYVSYSNEQLGTFKGRCSQWDLATNNDFDVSFTESGRYTFTSPEEIKCTWWGSALGEDLTVSGQGNPNLAADTHSDSFSKLPSFTIEVLDEVKVEKIKLEQTELLLNVGETSVLTATVLPENATNKTVTYRSDKEEIATVDDSGLVTAVSAGTAIITAKAGEKTAVCEVTVKETEQEQNGEPFDLFTSDGKRLNLEETDVDWNTSGSMLSGKEYRVQVPKGTNDIKIKFYQTDVTVMKADGSWETIIESGKKEANLEIALGEKNGVLFNHGYDYDYAFFEEIDVEVPDSEPVGKVAVSIQDMVPTPEGEDWPEAKGVILEETQVAIYPEDTMMDAIERVCAENGLSIEISGGTYITEIAGLEQFERGSGSGWMGTLNGWFTDRGFADFKVADGTLANGDVITLEYTTQQGFDLTDAKDKTGELKTLGYNIGKLSPEFVRDVYEYELEIPSDTKGVSFKPELFNRNHKVEITSEEKVYRYGAMIPVQDGTEIRITSVSASPISLSNLLKNENGATYVITIRQEAENQAPEDPKPEQPQKEEITLTDAQYKVSLTGQELTSDMQLIVSKLTKEDAAVDVIRDAIPSSKGVFGLYHVTLIQNGREITLSGSADLKLPIGEKYNGKTMDVLLHNSGTIEKLTGKAADGYLTVKVKKLGDFGVVTEMPDSTEEATNPSAQSGAGNGQSGTVKTGDRMQTVYFVYLLAACVAGTCIVIGKKRRQGK